MDGPVVAVGISEEAEATPGEVLDRGDVHPALQQGAVDRLDVVDIELYAAQRPWRGADITGLQRDGARRPGWHQLDEAMGVVEPHVLCDAETDLLDVEIRGPVDVGHGNGDELEAHLHPALLVTWAALPPDQHECEDPVNTSDAGLTEHGRSGSRVGARGAAVGRRVRRAGYRALRPSRGPNARRASASLLAERRYSAAQAARSG